jgi:DNA-directed RNA polymerase subunit M/transcription elongation factor TFIIS
MFTDRKSHDMDCPECGGSLSTYRLSSREAYVCEECGYVGIQADHHGDPEDTESWTDALRRFHEENVDVAVGGETTPVKPTPDSEAKDDTASDESGDDVAEK